MCSCRAASNYQATAWDQDNEDALAALEKELEEEEVNRVLALALYFDLCLFAV